MKVVLRQPQVRIETAGGERGDRTRRISHEKPRGAADPPQQATNGIEPPRRSALSGRPTPDSPGARTPNRSRAWRRPCGKRVRIAGHADVAHADRL